LSPARADDEFVLIKSGVLPVQPAVRVDAFEILNHTLTNAEYGKFVAATGHPAPINWEGGRIPPGTEDWPVVFVTRFDVDAYMKWRSQAEGRIYRLPMMAEFEFAARAGSAEPYPWGNAAASGKANFDPTGTRSMGDWRQYTKPVKSYPPNAWGLYDMAGNAWQMVSTQPDYQRMAYLFRLQSPLDLDDRTSGGSWLRTEKFLRCGTQFRVRSGQRRPDVGFRPVRAPLGSSHFQQQRRRVAAAPAGGGAVYIGWQLLPQDDARTGFHVYRSIRRDSGGERITAEPVRTSTNFLDRQAPQVNRIYYRVRPVGPDGREGPPSEWAGAEPSHARSGLIAVFEPTVQQGGFYPVFGDLDGDGVLECVVKLDNGIHEMSRDPGVPVELEALTLNGISRDASGSALWRRPLAHHDHCFGNANDLPVVVYDLDGDGKDEVIVRLQDGDSMYLAVLDGLSGRVLRKTPWTEMVSDRTITSSRVHMAVAYLDGKHPSIITQTGLYENEVIDAFDASLKRLWTYKSFGATSGSGSHHIDIADVDGDGKDEVFDGTTLLNPDGTMRWSAYLEHADAVHPFRILPGKFYQVFYGVESMRPGAYLVDARNGKIIWKQNDDDNPRWKHTHNAWVADIWDGSPGLEIMACGNGAADPVLFSSDGKIIADPWPGGWRPVNWTGAATRDLMTSNGNKVGRFNGKGITELPGPGPNAGDGGCIMTADLVGDFRDEVVCMGTTEQGRRAIFVYSNIEPVERRGITRLASRGYRLWLARNVSAGYGQYYEWQP
jgi:rhamnogalacturonan endolyase